MRGGALNSFAIGMGGPQNLRVDSPLAILFYEDLIPGTQLVNRLQDLRYRVQVAATPGELLNHAAKAGPMLIFLDLVSQRNDACELIRRLRSEKPTNHVPVIGFADDAAGPLQTLAKEAGATLVVSDSALLAHLEQFIEQALQVE